MAEPRSAVITESPASSPGRHKSPTQGTLFGQLSSAERRHYNRALKEMYKIVKLGSRRFDVSESEVDGAPQNTDTDATSNETDDTFTSGHSVKLSGSTGHKPARPRKSLSFQDEDEDLTEGKQRNIRKVYAELMQINKKLQRENAVLLDREQRLRERENALREAEQLEKTTDLVLERLVDDEVARRCQQMDEQYQSDIAQLEDMIQKKTRELKRVHASFDTIKTANDSLKKQLSELQEQNKRLETQALSVQHRLANLQRKNDFTLRHNKQDERMLVNHQERPRTQKVQKDGCTESGKSVSFSLSKINFSGMFEVLAVLLEWISEAHLQKQPTFQPSHDGNTLQEQLLDFPSALIHEKCMKILPPLADILNYLPSVNPKVQYPCLQFTYWSIVYIEQTVRGSQRTALASTLRHIGEGVFRPQVLKISETAIVAGGRSDKQKADIYFHSPNLAVRFLSCLIVLKTLTQVDSLAHAFDVLKRDLREDMTKQLFLAYDGMNVVLPYMKPVQKALLSSAVDVMLQMSMESPLLDSFLECCSSEVWFRTCVNLLQHKGMDVKIIEKLSIVLQRLSKNKSNRRFFEAFQIGPIVQELVRTSDPQNAFLLLNLRSVVFNLTQPPGK